MDVGALRRLRRTDPTDFVLAVLCFAGVLVFGLLIGLAIAVVLSLLALVYRAYRPSYAVLGRAPGAVDDELLRYRGIEDHPDCETFPGLVILRVDGELFFANARWFRDTVRSLVRDQSPPVRELLVHVGAVPHLDTTAATMLKELIAELQDADIELAFARATTGLVHDMERNGVVELIGDRPVLRHGGRGRRRLPGALAVAAGLTWPRIGRAVQLAAMLTSQSMPNLSRSMPNVSPQGAFSSGTVSVPPSRSLSQ